MANLDIKKYLQTFVKRSDEDIENSAEQVFAYLNRSFRMFPLDRFANA